MAAAEKRAATETSLAQEHVHTVRYLEEMLRNSTALNESKLTSAMASSKIVIARNEALISELTEDNTMLAESEQKTLANVRSFEAEANSIVDKLDSELAEAKSDAILICEELHAEMQKCTECQVQLNTASEQREEYRTEFTIASAKCEEFATASGTSNPPLPNAA